MNLDLNIIQNSLLEVLILLLDKRLVDFVLSNCATFFGSELSADSVKAKFRPLIKSLNWTKCCRVKIDPNQQVRRLISNGELSTHATVQDISPGDNVEVTVNIAPYFNREYFGNCLKCTDVVLTTKQPKFGVSGVPLNRAHVVEAENAAARERERVVEAANAAAREARERERVVEAANAAARERERERAVEAENAAATRKQERNKARRLRVEIEYAEQLARLQAEKEKAEARLKAEKEKAEAAIENSDTDE
jgi:flagellar biosynthesis GTPase FlhF